MTGNFLEYKVIRKWHSTFSSCNSRKSWLLQSHRKTVLICCFEHIMPSCPFRCQLRYTLGLYQRLSLILCSGIMKKIDTRAFPCAYLFTPTHLAVLLRYVCECYLLSLGFPKIYGATGATGATGAVIYAQHRKPLILLKKHPATETCHGESSVKEHTIWTVPAIKNNLLFKRHSL